MENLKNEAIAGDENGNGNGNAGNENVNSASGNAGTAGENKFRVRIPLSIFTKHMDLFPRSIAAKAKKAGIENTSGERQWGPTIEVGEKEVNQIFEVAENLYRSKSVDKASKSFGYQLRRQAAALIDRKVVNQRSYTRKPKAVSQPMQASNDEAPRLAAAMPPRNLGRATSLLKILADSMDDDKLASNMLHSIIDDLQPSTQE